MNSIRTLLLSICFISLFNRGFSQELPLTKNAFYLELFGNGGFYSINYERNIHHNIYSRIGFATFQTFDIFDRSYHGKITTVPLIVSYLSGFKKHHFEIGGGLLFGKIKEGSESNPIFDVTGFLGYRYQSLISEGFLFRIGLAPFVSLNATNYPDRFFISPGLSFGYSF
jgi:hypothetical protein